MMKGRTLLLAALSAMVLPSLAHGQGALTNGDNHAGAISVPGQLDEWTFTAAQGDAVSLSVGEVLAGGLDPGFVPWIRLRAPNGTQLGSNWGNLVAHIDVTVPLSGTYSVVIGSADSGNDATGSYRITLARTPATFTVPAGDEGGALLNGANHLGTIHVGDLDQWTFTASQGDAISVSIGEILDSEIDPGFVPWIRLRGPTGAQLGNDWGNWVGQIDVTAPLSGTYTVVVSTADSGSDAVGDYQLTLARTPATFVVPTGDHGGAMTNGANHEGAIHIGDLDQWTFTAAQGDAISLSIGEILDSEIDPGFVPWIRLRGPTGVQLGNDWGNWVAQIDVTAPLSGTYTVVVSTADSGRDAVGDYQLTLARTPATFVVPTGDHGGAMTNGANHEGAIHIGDLDQWTFTAAQGDAISLSIGEILDSEIDPGFVPWIRLRGPTGVQLGNDWGNWVAQIDVTAPLSGTYTVVVSTADSGSDATGRYRLTLARTPATFVVPTGDHGGAMTNGANHEGAIHIGDLDQWTFTAAQGDAISVSIGEILDSEIDPGFVPWIRLRGPNGAQLGNTWGNWVAQIDITAALSGTYTGGGGTADSGQDAMGRYRLTLAHTPATFVVPTGDEGGVMTNGVTHAGAIHIGDLDQWTFNAMQGATLSLTISEVVGGEVDPGFWPWIRLRSPTGATLGSDWGNVTAQLQRQAPVTGLYTVVVGTADSGADGTGNYLLKVLGASSCLPSITPTTAAAPVGGGAGQVTVSADAGCAWTAQSQVPWITMTGGGTGPGLATYTVAPNNTGAVRTGTLLIAGHTVTITQAGPAQTFVVTPTSGPNGRISPATPQSVASGSSVPFTLTPDPDYVVSAVGGTCGGVRAGTIFTTAPVTQACTVTVTFVRVGTFTDTDGDGLDDDWETRYGLLPGDATGDNGAHGDPDDDGRTNIQEFDDGTHPRGFVITYLAEGATGAFFSTRLALANPNATPALVLVRYQKGNGEVIPSYFTIAAHSRHTIDVQTVPGLEAAEFSTLIEADVQVVADRTMTWDSRAYGAHAERGLLTRTATRWYFAEGATHSGFELFYLIQNPTNDPATVEVTYLRPAPAVPLVKTYPVGPQSRFNIWVDNEARVDPALASLAAADVSAIVTSTNGVPIIAERAMYRHASGVTYGAGHESAGATELATTWFLAEGATGPFFDLFVLIANPTPDAALVEARYLLPSGQTLTRQYTVPALSRFNIWVDHEDPILADTAVSTTISSVNAVPVVVERAMWWPGTPSAASWYEAHNSPGSTTTGTRWALAEGETGGPRDVETYVLIANTSDFAGQARVTLFFEDGTSATRTFPLTPNSRFNVEMKTEFPSSAGRRYGTLVESLGAPPAQIVVERAMYWDAMGQFWGAGTNALATKLQ